MKIKVWLAFFAGVALTAGVFYVASRRQPAGDRASVATRPLPAATAVVAQPVSAPSPQPEPVQAQPPVSPPEPPPGIVKHAPPKPVHTAQRIEKPSAAEPRGTPEPVAVAETHPPSEPALAPETSAPAEPPQPVPEPAPARVEPPQSVPATPPAPEPDAFSEPPPPTVTIPAGTLISVRLGVSLSTDQNQSGDVFSASIDEPVVAGGFIIAERGARAQGRVVESTRAGRVKGLAHLAIQLTGFHTADGQRIRVETLAFQRYGPRTEGQDAAKMGGGAALGAVIGAIAGGGKGAAIGAGVGGAAGAGTVMATRGKPASLASETRISFRLEKPVTITQRPLP